MAGVECIKDLYHFLRIILYLIKSDEGEREWPKRRNCVLPKPFMALVEPVR
jgi:hypothetical protein